MVQQLRLRRDERSMTGRFPLLPFACDRHDDCLDVRGEIIRTVLCCIVYCSYVQFLSHWTHFTVHRFICVYVCVLCVCYLVILHMCCITGSTVEWTWCDWRLIGTLLQCIDTVGWVIWPVKTRPWYDLECVWWDVKPYSINHFRCRTWNRANSPVRQLRSEGLPCDCEAYARSCYRHSFCPSVCPSVKRVYCDKTR